MRKALIVFLIVLGVALALPVACRRAEPADTAALEKIKLEAFQRSQVMDTVGYLSDVIGPRMTGTPGFRAAADYTMKKMTEWGLVNVKTENWGPFGRGWENERFSAQVVSPTAYSLIGYPMAWTPGTHGTVTAQAVLAVMRTEADFAKFRGQLKGKIVLPAPMRQVNPHFLPDAVRYSDWDLTRMALHYFPGERPEDPQGVAAQRFNVQRAEFLQKEGVAAMFEPNSFDDGTVWVQGGSAPDPKSPPVPPRVSLAIEHYGRIFRTLQRNIPVTIELNIQNKFLDGDANTFNVLGEIPGTDKAEEIVLIGAHLDSWHAGTGATDNAAGVAAILEAARILKATGLKLRRTVRIGLWSGEELGLWGSRAFVQEHFADPATMSLKPEHARLSAYFNLDRGAGAIRGIYLQGNSQVKPIFDSWMKPLKDLRVTTLNIRNIWWTDHLSFDDVGLPAFQFIQDNLDYDRRTHHTNMDTYERIVPQDLQQMAVVVAFFAYQTASREQMLPRKPLPKPQPAPKQEQPAAEQQP